MHEDTQVKLVIVEDDRLLLENLSILLGGESLITVEGAYSSAEGTDRVASQAP